MGGPTISSATWRAVPRGKSCLIAQRNQGRERTGRPMARTMLFSSRTRRTVTTSGRCPWIRARRSPRPTTFAERERCFSTDGKWIAYQSGRIGAIESLRAAVPARAGSSDLHQTAGAQGPMAPDGKEITSGSRRPMMAAPVRWTTWAPFVEAPARRGRGSPHGSAARGPTFTRQAVLVSRDGHAILDEPSCKEEVSTGRCTVI